MKKIIFLSFAFWFLFFPNLTLAQQQTNSNTTSTKVGNPKDSDSSLLKAGEAVKTAYEKCNSGLTTATSIDCLNQSLSSSGYSQTQMSAFDSAVSGALVANDQGPMSGIPCVQCLGFIKSVGALIAGNIPQDLAQYNASAVARLQSFTIGSTTYKQISYQNAKPGDIAAIDYGQDGHIFIVKEMQGSIAVTLEANGGFDCQISEGNKRPVDGYVFFSPQ